MPFKKKKEKRKKKYANKNRRNYVSSGLAKQVV